MAIEIAAGAHFFDDINCLKIDAKYFCLRERCILAIFRIYGLYFLDPGWRETWHIFLPVFLSQQISGVFFCRCSFLEFYLTAVGKRYQETPLKGVPPAVR